ncbi:MAG TPA: hypothetical protein PLU72_15340 [Candidatus Ozemobacteraceae bacterium]|nr:hypothetical protein [Candidatus Ozemobacteraceae bacterium]HQG28197.1 hypothetical protein [Candidatus Ozemobacteraceae bacterium]
MSEAQNPSKERHSWRFFRSGGVDQVCLDSGADLEALRELDPKLWMALSCPVQGLELDAATLALIDSDKDGRVRVPEVLSAVEWVCSRLKNPEDLLKRSETLALASINDADDEGKRLVASARRILAGLGKPDADTIAVTDVADASKKFAATRFNGDGIVPPAAAGDEAGRKLIEEIISCVGGVDDRSGVPGVDEARLGVFVEACRAYDAWWRAGEADPAILPYRGDTVAAYAAFSAVRAKIDDFFTRCRLAAFDARSTGPLNRSEKDYEQMAVRMLSSGSPELADLPLARIEAGWALPLNDAVNPAWTKAIETFNRLVVLPRLGEKTALTSAEWDKIVATFSAHETWLAGKTGTCVERLGLPRVRAILGVSLDRNVRELIAQDKALASEAAAIDSVERLVRLHRDLYTLLNNMVSFRDFYDRKRGAVFQNGTLYLDGRSCDLCMRVDDVSKHAAMAALSQTYLAYCDCVRSGSSEKMSIVAAFTAGDAELLAVGRHGIFVDRRGRDWDAVVVKLVEHPISIGEAFWTPYRRIGRMITEQVEKFAGAGDKAMQEKLAGGIAGAAEKAQAAAAPAAGGPPAASPAFDVGRFAGIFAAIGLAIGAIGTAIASVVTGFLALSWWQMPLAVFGLILLVSGPSMIMAAIRLRNRNIGPILDANGWAVNSRLLMSIAFGGSLTKTAELPAGATRSLEDPFADAENPWPRRVIWLLVFAILAVAGYRLHAMKRWKKHPGKAPAACSVPAPKPGLPAPVPSAPAAAPAPVAAPEAAAEASQASETPK